MNRRVGAVRLAFGAALLWAGAAVAGLFPTYPLGTGPGVWEVDRYAPAGFTNAGTVNGRPNVLALALSAADSQANRPPAFSSAFYNTQGRGFQVDLPAYSVLYGSLYLPSAWATTNAGNAALNRRSEMWGVLSPATGGDTCAGSACNLFPIVGFTNASASDPLNQGGAGRYRVFDSNIGFVDLGTPVAYDQWTDVCTAFTGTELRFYINGAQAYVQASLVQGDPSFGPPTKFTRETIQAYNFGTDYTAQWSSLGAGTLAAAAVAAGNAQTAAVGTPFATALQVRATDTSGAPLPCVPVTFAAPGAGASAVLSALTVITDRQGIAQVTATANGTAGAYVVAASAPGVAGVSFNLANVGVPAAIAATGGAGQSTPVGTAFAAPLVARVTDGGGNPVAGALVSFALPLSGPAATFPGSVATATATTDGSGFATSPIVTANALPGGYAGTASVTGVATPAGFALTNTIVPAALTKTMLPATIDAGGTSVLTLTLGNANAVALTLSAPFDDILPAGVTATSVNTGTCTGVTVTTLSITKAAGSAIPVNGCTIVVTVTSSTAGTVINTTTALITSGGTSPPASAALTVVGSGGSGVTLAKSMLPAAIVAGGTATLTLTLGNAGAVGVALTAPFVDTMPAGLTTVGGHAGTCPGVTVGPTSLAMATGAVIPAGGCTIVATVTSSTPGTVTNTTGILQTTAGAVAAASAQLTVNAAPPGLTKRFAPVAIVPGASATLTLALAPAHPVALTLTAPFSDTMPPGITIAGADTGSCPGVVATATSISMSAGTVLPAGGCTIVVTVTSSTPGVAVNTTSALATSGGTAPAASATLTVTVVALAAAGGGGQATVIGTPFPAALRASVTAGALPVAGMVVTFNLPAADPAPAAAGAPSGTFPGGAASATAVTDALGIATSPPITANGIAGTFVASAAVAGVANPIAYSLTNLAAVPVAAEPIPALGIPGLLALVLALLALGRRTLVGGRRP